MAESTPGIEPHPRRTAVVDGSPPPVARWRAASVSRSGVHCDAGAQAAVHRDQEARPDELVELDQLGVTRRPGLGAGRIRKRYPAWLARQVRTGDATCTAAADSEAS
jgi:hypothetical protein